MRKQQVLWIASFVFVSIGCQTSPEPGWPDQPKFEDLMKQVLSNEIAPDREVIVSLVEIPPHTRLKRHWHPGEEFHYYLEGEVTIELDGKPDIVGKPGTVGHVPLKAVHTAVTHERGARILVFRVHLKGKPVRYLVDGDSEKK